MFSKSEITLYVPYFNAGRTVGRCIESLKNQSITPHEIIIVNDGSEEPLPSGLNCRILVHEENKGLSAARNTALHACETPLIASVDADVIADKKWLEELLFSLNREDLSGVGGKMEEFYGEGLGNQWRAAHMAQNWGDKAITNPRFLFGANSLFIKDHLLEAGGYNEDLRTNNEDRTMSDLLYAKSRRLYYEPKAKCAHLRQDSLETILSGYWGWHHAKGLSEGDFDTKEGVLSRIGRVNYGISNYRYNLDKEKGRYEFLILDLLIPYVFCAKDICFFCKRNSLPVPDLSLLAKVISEKNTDYLLKFIPGDFCTVALPEWFTKYLRVFKEFAQEFMTAEKLYGLEFSTWLGENRNRVFEERN